MQISKAVFPALELVTCDGPVVRLHEEADPGAAARLAFRAAAGRGGPNLGSAL
ncbi:hypothetical protein [Streptomyces triculaminicus]|uniref:hypothetical protein n=1 Tax=Streptomyces triculaminicus TaxID=2816232 RepID=UPI0037D6F2BF